ncbi:achaete-scute homolog 1a-like [Bacillus rossius redtenbacheri]|uniref:achaete-scute homolog 1a-like n=1 Tax=Bacillus rossius redtenbacheri TaxID=93214 RepID=UPI002FDD6368
MAAAGFLAVAPQQQQQQQQQPSSSEALHCKRRISFAYASSAPHQPASVARRNARERNRVKQVNNGFATLRQHIPAAVAAALSPPAPAASPGAAGPQSSRAASRKLSKVETLRMAVEYIRGLQRLLDEHSPAASTQVSGADPDHGYCSASPPSAHRRCPPPSPDTASSPAPSFASEGSTAGSAAYNCENYEPMSPEDEELLDVISWWQQSH